jgi:hypothetical protein
MMAVLVVLVVLGAIAAGAVLFAQSHKLHVPFVSNTCRVFADDDVVRLAPDQITHAATIAAVGVRAKVPDRAVTIALATAMQESKLRNLGGGDRDSIGLFQQRPSQGWGTPAQLREPRYAAGKFYEKLLRTVGWQTMSVNDAAQAVQNSGTPQAYAEWEADAAALSKAFLGAETGAVTCQLRSDTRITGADGSRVVGEELKNDLGALTVRSASDGDAPGLTVAVRSAKTSPQGWRAAHWLVAKSHEHGIRRVAYAGVEWTAESGKWQKGGSTPDDRIDVAMNTS